MLRVDTLVPVGGTVTTTDDDVTFVEREDETLLRTVLVLLATELVGPGVPSQTVITRHCPAVLMPIEGVALELTLLR